MVSKTVLATAAIATVGVSAQVDGIINSIVAQISNGIVAGRKSNVPESQASSEVAQIITAINANTDIQNLFTKAAGAVLGGINSDGVLQLVDNARSSLAAFEGSDNFKTADSLIGKYITDLNPPVALSAVQVNLSPILGLVLPPIQSLSSAHENVAASVEEVKTVAASLINKVLLSREAASSAAAATSSAAASSAAATSSAAASSAASSAAPSSAVSSAAPSSTPASSKAPESSTPVTKPASSTVHSSSHASSVAAATSSSLSQVNGGAAVQGGILAAGFVAAGALLL